MEPVLFQSFQNDQDLNSPAVKSNNDSDGEEEVDDYAFYSEEKDDADDSVIQF